MHTHKEQMHAALIVVGALFILIAMEIGSSEPGWDDTWRFGMFTIGFGTMWAGYTLRKK